MGYNLCANLRNLNVPFSINLGAGVEFKNYNGSDTFRNCFSYNASFDIPYFTENCCNMFNNCREFNAPLNITEHTPIVNMYGMFSNCLSFNQDINIPTTCNNFYNSFNGYFEWGDPRYNDSNYLYTKNVHVYATHTNGFEDWIWGRGWYWYERNDGDYTHLLSYFARFNGNVIFHHPVEDLTEAFYACSHLNVAQPIPRGVRKVYEMYGQCHSFNAPVTFPDTIEDAREVFVACTSLNRRIDLPDNIEANQAFEMCYNLNVAQRLPANSNIAYFFWTCPNFSQPTYIPYSRYNYQNNYDGTSKCYKVHHVDEIFYNCINFSAPVTFNDMIEGLPPLFGSSAFNQPIVLPSSLKYDGGIFSGSSFNTTVTYPSGVEVMRSSFQGCGRYNQSPELPSSLIWAESIFKNCVSLDRTIHIPSSVKDLLDAFADCHELTHMPSLPHSVNQIGGLFRNCCSLYTSMFNIEESVIDCAYALNGSKIINFNLRSARLDGAYSGYAIVNVDMAGNTFGKTPSDYHLDGNNNIVGSGLGDPIGVAYFNSACRTSENNTITDYNVTHFIPVQRGSMTVESDFNSAKLRREDYARWEPERKNNYWEMRYNYGRLYCLGDDSFNNSTLLFADYRNASTAQDIKFYWYKIVLY